MIQSEFKKSQQKEISSIIAKILTAQRLKLEMDVNQMAERCRLEPRNLQTYEKRGTLDLGMICYLAKHYKLSVIDLIKAAVPKAAL